MQVRGVLLLGPVQKSGLQQFDDVCICIGMYCYIEHQIIVLTPRQIAANRWSAPDLKVRSHGAARGWASLFDERESVSSVNRRRSQGPTRLAVSSR